MKDLDFKRILNLIKLDYLTLCNDSSSARGGSGFVRNLIKPDHLALMISAQPEGFLVLSIV